MRLFKLLQLKYDEFDRQVRTYLSKLLTDYNIKYGNSTIFGQLLNVLNSVVQNIILYIEDSLTEQNKYTAQRKKSIYSLAQLTGYNPSLGKAASCDINLLFIPSNDVHVDVLLKNHTKIYSLYNGLAYNIILPRESIILSYDNNDISKHLHVVEGTFDTQEFVSTGGQYYTYNVRFSGDMDIDYFTVYVNNELWTRAESIYDMDADGKQYVVKTSLVNGVDILFGNDQFGRALKDGDIVKVEYLLHSGELGNIPYQGDMNFVFADEGNDVSGNNISLNEIFNITLYNNSPVCGGTYSETTDQVQNMIGFNSRSMVLADSNNYKNMLNKFSFVGYNRTWSEEGSLIVNSLVLKNYAQNISEGKEYFNLTKKDFFLDSDQRRSILQYINNSGNQLAGVTYRLFDPELCRYACFVYLKCKDTNYDKITIENKVRNLIGDFFCNIESDQFIPKSDIVYLLKKNIDDIDSVDVFFLSEQNEKAIINSKYSKKISKYNISTGTYDTTTENIYIAPGDDPGIGLDEYGNILIENNDQFPVLMGGWLYKPDRNIDQLNTAEGLTIVFR